MVEIKLFHESPTSIIAIVNEIRDGSYVQGIDFDFFYYPADYNGDSFIPKHTIFKFYNEELSSWFTLKYA